MNTPALAAALASLLLATAAGAQTSAFDGTWKVSMKCPATNDSDGAKGYGHDYTGTVTSGEFDALYGAEGEPGMQHLHGRIGADGKAVLTLDGIVSRPEYAIRKAQKGKPFSSAVEARFEGATGTGRRLKGRVCDFEFKRQ